MVRFALRGGGVALGGVAAAAAEAVRHALITPKSKVTVTSCCGGLRGGGGFKGRGVFGLLRKAHVAPGEGERSREAAK